MERERARWSLHHSNSTAADMTMKALPGHSDQVEEMEGVTES